NGWPRINRPRRRRKTNSARGESPMTRHTLLHLCAPLALVAGGAMVSAQTLLPSAPPKGFGASVTPAFEGWFDNPDGTHSFLIGYFNRNTKSEPEAALGPE